VHTIGTEHQPFACTDRRFQNVDRHFGLARDRSRHDVAKRVGPGGLRIDEALLDLLGDHRMIACQLREEIST